MSTLKDRAADRDEQWDDEGAAARQSWQAANTIVVTRHPALVQHLREIGLIPEGCPVITHVTPDDVRNKSVIGVLPLALAALARDVTEVPMDLPQELRGQELTIGQVRQFAGQPVTYHVGVLMRWGEFEE